MKAYENFAQLQASPTRGGWLKTVATNLCLNHLSRYRKRWSFFSDLRRGHEEDSGDDQPAFDVAVPDTLLDELEAGERARIVEQALADLPDRQRIPLVLFHFEEMPYTEIAARLGVSLSKVKIDILRGRVAVASALSAQAPAAGVHA